MSDSGRRTGLPAAGDGAGARGRCASCRFWESRDPSAELGECRRHAPRPYRERATAVPTERSAWPNTCPSDWCGEHQAKRDEPPGPVAPTEDELIGPPFEVPTDPPPATFEDGESWTAGLVRLERYRALRELWHRVRRELVRDGATENTVSGLKPRLMALAKQILTSIPEAERFRRREADLSPVPSRASLAAREPFLPSVRDLLRHAARHISARPTKKRTALLQTLARLHATPEGRP